MKISFGIAAVLVLAGFLLASCGRVGAPKGLGAQEASAEESGPVPAALVPPPHPMSIEALRDRKYSADPVVLGPPVPAAAGLAAEEFTYVSDGLTIHGLLERPDRPATEGGWPVIVVAHGYIPPSSWSTRENYRLVTRHYASGGFLVVKPDYRGHGRSEGRGGSAARTIDYSIDVLNLIAGLDAVPDADTDNVFLYGHSMGGEIGLRILTVSHALRGASLWAGVTEDYPENTLYFVRKRSAEEAERLQALIDTKIKREDYPSLSPGNYLDSIDVPLIIHHGTADESVPFAWSVPFRAALDEAGVDYRFYEYPGQDHNISGSFYTALDRDMEFFRSLME